MKDAKTKQIEIMKCLHCDESDHPMLAQLYGPCGTCFGLRYFPVDQDEYDQFICVMKAIREFRADEEWQKR